MSSRKQPRPRESHRQADAPKRHLSRAEINRKLLNKVPIWVRTAAVAARTAVRSLTSKEKKRVLHAPSLAS